MKRIAVVCLLVLGLGGCSAAGSAGAGGANGGAAILRSVTYRVTSDASIGPVEWMDGSVHRGTADVPSPWSVRVRDRALGTLHVSAQVGVRGGVIRCEIVAGGRVLASKTASGAYASVACDA